MQVAVTARDPPGALAGVECRQNRLHRRHAGKHVADRQPAAGGRAVRIAGAAGLGEKFMGYPGEQAKFVGHGVGLELDELPVLAQRFRVPLTAGQTIAIEPKFAFPGKGVVGIENTYAVTETGCEKITDFPDDIVYL